MGLLDFLRSSPPESEEVEETETAPPRSCPPSLSEDQEMLGVFRRYRRQQRNLKKLHREAIDVLKDAATGPPIEDM